MSDGGRGGGQAPSSGKGNVHPRPSFGNQPPARGQVKNNILAGIFKPSK